MVAQDFSLAQAPASLFIPEVQCSCDVFVPVEAPYACVGGESPSPADPVERKLQELGAKLHDVADQLIDDVRQTFLHHHSFDELERTLWQRLLDLGRSTIETLLGLLGTGDVGPTLDLDGRVLKRLTVSSRDFTCTFGTFVLLRHPYGPREKQAQACVPLDERLALPEGKFSYLLQEWDQSLAMEAPFRTTGKFVERILKLDQSVDSLEEMNRRMSRSVESFHQTQTTPPAETEGPILVQTVDHKGVPLRHEADRPAIADHDPEGEERADRKRMATVAGVYTILPFVRTPTDIVEALFCDPRTEEEPAPQRPKPLNKRLRACLPHVNMLGETIDGTAAMFGWMADETKTRQATGSRTLIHLTDGEERLRTELSVFQADVSVETILDLLHVTPRLWTAARLLCRGEAERQTFVKDRVRQILEGRTRAVVTGFHNLATRRRLGSTARAELERVCHYFTANADRMRYDEYLAKGYPIASGVIEGACRHVVKDRMERTGMSWVVDGAQCMLNLRCLWLSGDWDTYLAFRIARETERLHPHRASLKEIAWAVAI